MSAGKSTGKFLETLAGTRFPTPPIWLMRQAGRYLPEYRAIRATTRSFLEFCYTPDKAVEVTLQPIRRFGFDAAIIFSDILVVPDALGQKVWFEEGEGPKLEALTDPAQFGQLSRARLPDHLAPVYEAIRQTRAALPVETALLGFAGAPFTLACYMIEGSGSRDFAKVKQWAYGHPESFGLLIDLLVEAVVDHLSLQVEAGADAVQLFDSWAGVLPEEQLFRWSLDPMVRIAQALRERHPEDPDHRLSARRRAGGADVPAAGCLHGTVDRYRHRRALGGQGIAAAHLPARQSRSDHAGGGWRRTGARGDAHPRQARQRVVRVQSRPRRRAADAARAMSRAWSRSCATGSRAHEDRHRPVQSRRTRFARGSAAVPAQPVQRSRDHRACRRCLRLPLARFIASRRAPKAQKIYAQIGGASPILGQTEAQARALEDALGTGTAPATNGAAMSACATGIR